MELVVFADQGCCLLPKLQAAAAVAGYTLTIEPVSKLQSSDSVVFRRYPAMCTPSGLVCGSNAALRYLGNANAAAELYGQSLADRAAVDVAVDAIGSEMETVLIAFKKGLVTAEKVKADLKQTLDAAEALLTKQTYLVGQRLTIADCAFAGILKLVAEKKIVDLTTYVSIARLMNTVFEVSKCKFRVEAKITQCVAKPAEPKKKAETAEKKAAPKETKPVASAEEAPKPKKEVGPSYTYDMDEWKRCYSNTKDLKGVAMPFFWKKWNAEECSVYRVKYQRYNDADNVQAFKASNLLGMFFQRIDNSVRKTGFAVFDVLKADGYYDIEGVFFLLGKDIPLALKEHDQFESFTWTKLNIPEDKPIVEAMFCECDTFEGREIADSKVYK